MPLKRRRRGRVRLGKRKKKVAVVKLIFALIITLSFISVLTWASRVPQLTIQTIEISGNAITTNESLEHLVQSGLSGRYWFLLPRSNIFIYPRRTIIQSVTDRFTRIDEANVSFVNFHTIALEVRERDPLALWCGETYNPSQYEEQTCYFLDKEGYIFAKSPNFSGNVFFRYYGHVEGEEDESEPIGRYFLPPSQFLGYNLFLDALRVLDVNPITLTRDAASDFSLSFDGGGVLIFGPHQNLNTVLGNLRSVLESDAFKERGIQGVEYIDLRFGNKVFYKPK